MSGEGFPATANQAADAAETVLDIEAARTGAAWLKEQGISYEVAAIRLRGPYDACDGTIAEMVGAPNHSDMKANVEQTIAAAKEAGQDPGQALEQSFQLFVRRDDSGDIVRVDPDDLKKK